MTGPQEGRSVAEWVTFVGSCCILAFVLGLILVQMRDPLDPQAPVAEVSGETLVVDGHHHVRVAVDNIGDKTAANVQVTAELEIDGATAGGRPSTSWPAVRRSSWCSSSRTIPKTACSPSPWPATPCPERVGQGRRHCGDVRRTRTAPGARGT